MSGRRNRRGSLAICLLAGLLMMTLGVCSAADGDAFPLDHTQGTPPDAARDASPYFDDERPVEVPRPTSAQRVIAKRAKPSTAAPAKGQSTIANDLIGELDTSAIGKTPLPDSDDADAETVTPTGHGRSGFGPSFAWAAGILAVGWIARQLTKGGGPLARGTPTAIELLSRQSIGPQQQLALVRFGRRILLVGTTPTGMSTLATVDDPAEVQAIVAELQPAPSKMGPTLFDLFRPQKNETPERAPTREAPPVNVTLSTEARSKSLDRRLTPQTKREVTDV